MPIPEAKKIQKFDRILRPFLRGAARWMWGVPPPPEMRNKYVKIPEATVVTLHIINNNGKFRSHRKHLIPITKNYNSHYNLPGPNKLKLWKIIKIAWKFIKIFVNKNLDVTVLTIKFSISKKRKKVKVAFLICKDVLVDIFDFCDRRELANLEKICRLFHGIVVRFFNEAPFLILAMECHTRQKSSRFNRILSSSDIENGRLIRAEREVLFH